MEEIIKEKGGKMSNRFLNDHKVRRIELSKVLRITAGGFHCWCDSNVGMIRKPNHAVPMFLWDTFLGKKPKTEPQTIVKKEMTYKLREEKLKSKWYQKLWNWIIKKLPGNIASGAESR